MKTEQVVIVISVILIIMAGFLAYGNSLPAGFIWDDRTLVAGNRLLRSWSGLPQMFTGSIGSGAGREGAFYRPLQILSYRFDYLFWRLNPAGYHLTGVLLHVLTALAFFWLAARLAPDPPLPFFAALLFVVHPVHTEAVTYVSGRADVLAALLMLACFNLYLRWYDSRSKPVFVLIPLSFAAALLAKEYSLILPVLILLYHGVFRKSLDFRLFLSLAAVAVLYFLLRAAVFQSWFQSYSIPSSGVRARMPGFLAAFFTYLRILVLPFGLHMEYGNRLFHWTEPAVLFGLALLLLLLIFAYRRRKRPGLDIFAAVFFLLALLPVSNVYPINAYLAEHWLYFPSLGFFLLLGSGLSFLFRRERSRAAAVVLIVFLTGFYACLTVRQNRLWGDPVAFYERLRRFAPASAAVHNNLGLAYSERRLYQEAIASFRKAAELDSASAGVFNNLGNACFALDRKEEAAEFYQRAIKLNPGFADAYYNLANVHYRLGRKETAAAVYAEAARLAPDHPEIYYNLGIVDYDLGRIAEAIGAFRRAIEIEPAHAAAHNNLAVAYYRDGKYELAARHAARAAELGYPVPPELRKLMDAGKIRRTGDRS